MACHMPLSLAVCCGLPHAVVTCGLLWPAACRCHLRSVVACRMLLSLAAAGACQIQERNTFALKYDFTGAFSCSSSQNCELSVASRWFTRCYSLFRDVTSIEGVLAR